MRVEQLGDGDPELAVVGGVHGDEPCGVRAIERLLDDDPDVERPVKCIVVNEKALERGVRYVDSDLNRSFTPDTPADAHERQLAQELAAEVQGMTVFSIHSTQSHADPFAVSDGRAAHVQRIVPRLSVVALVDTQDFGDGRLFAADADIVEVEAGLQGSETAAENAYTLAREFLTVEGALPGDAVERELPAFTMGDPIPKPAADEYEVFAENFSFVEAGDPVAAADGEVIRADRDFYPVLLSPYGYANQFGYHGQKQDSLGQSPSGANSTSVNSRPSAQ
ncbi:succinylglutamate desuccinylase/aspartoacylase family protein [Salarchaeum sp. JOR-1]|uniref:succinylglutamate desuccinylase/aspartoacylase domain-containing protein n=1 Tax=Salarchaeum sp. JOR-1 TaxID=2599399 RepID=UPI00119888AC|nr:succinylglutamate desuccinylase/aspartoacylase family protein [Salarchaeum sp. JOR-1]QDX41626.1 succinylglutamate desuccinylase [Salarchaeum sp. JOR-1]